MTTGDIMNSYGKGTVKLTSRRAEPRSCQPQWFWLRWQSAPDRPRRSIRDIRT